MNVHDKDARNAAARNHEALYCAMFLDEDETAFGDDEGFYVDTLYALQKKKAAAMNDAYPFRFAEMWLFDPPWYFNVLWAIMRLFMKKKLRDRIHVVSKSSAKDMQRLGDRFSKEQLPVKFGGELTPEQSKAAMVAWVAERMKAEA